MVSIERYSFKEFTLIVSHFSLDLLSFTLHKIVQSLFAEKMGTSTVKWACWCKYLQLHVNSLVYSSTFTGNLKDGNPRKKVLNHQHEYFKGLSIV